MSTMNFNDSSGSLTSTSVRYSVLKSPYWPAIVSTALAVPEATPGPLESDVPSHGRAGGVGVLMATMFLVALMGGAGILNLPAAVAGTGIIVKNTSSYLESVVILTLYLSERKT